MWQIWQVDDDEYWTFLGYGEAYGIPQVNTGNTGCEYTTIQTDATKWQVRIANATNPGPVTITASVDGYCFDGSNVTWTVTETLQVELPKNTACASCGGFSDGIAYNNSVDFRLNLGPVSPQENGGFVWLKEDTASTNLTQPASLKLYSSNVEILRDGNGVIQQVRTPQNFLVNITNLNDFEYHLQCYYAVDVGVKTNGYYPTNGAPPFCIWKLQNPDTTNNVNRLYITEQRDGVTRQFRYTNDANNLRWDLGMPDTNITVSVWKVGVLVYMLNV